MAKVDLRLKAKKRAKVGDDVHVHLILASDGDEKQIHSSIHAIIKWNPDMLELRDYEVAHPDWWSDAEFKRNVWRMNEGLRVPKDGDGLFVMWTKVNYPIYARPKGTKTVTFVFRALVPGATEVAFIKRFYKKPLPVLYTEVFGDLPPNSRVTGVVGPPAEVTIR